MENYSIFELKRILETAKINRAVLIDDFFDKPNLDLLVRTNWATAAPILQAFFPNLEFVGEDDLDIDECIKKASELELRESQLLAAKISVNNSVLPSDYDAIQNLENLFEMMQIPIKYLPVSDWKIEEIAESTTENEAKDMVFVDLDLSNTSESVFKARKGGAILIDNCLKNPNYRKNAIFAILTHDSSIEDELVVLSSIASEYDLPLKNFVVLSKLRLRSGKAIEEGIQLALVNLDSQHIKDKFGEILDAALTTTVKRLKGMSISSFFHSIIKSAEKEGTSEFDVLLRLMSIFLEDSLTPLLVQNGVQKDFRQRINQMIQIAGSNWQPETSPFRDQLLGLMHIERFSDNRINDLFHPVSNGDVFLINNETFILLAQPCDLALRSSGERTSIMVTLLKVLDPSPETEESRKAQLDHKLTPKIGNATEMSFWDTSGTKKIIQYTKGNLQISLDLLDLVSFNTSGEAVFSRSSLQGAKELLPTSGRKRLEKIVAIYDRAFQQYKRDFQLCNSTYVFIKDEKKRRAEIAAAKGEKPAAIQNLDNNKIPEILTKAHFLEITLNAKVLPTIETSTDQELCVTFQVKRIMRIREPYATFFLLGYSQNQARPGLPGELLLD